jgi:hypothetical protein
VNRQYQTLGFGKLVRIDRLSKTVRWHPAECVPGVQKRNQNSALIKTADWMAVTIGQIEQHNGASIRNDVGRGPPWQGNAARLLVGETSRLHSRPGWMRLARKPFSLHLPNRLILKGPKPKTLRGSKQTILVTFLATLAA